MNKKYDIIYAPVITEKAAEMAVPNMIDLINYLKQLTIRLNENINKKINYQKLLLESYKTSFVIKNPMIIYENKKQKIDLLKENIIRILIKKLDNNKNKLENMKKNYTLNNPKNLYKNHIIKINTLIEKLELVNPLGILKRGYSLTSQENKIIKSLKDLNTEKDLKIKLHDGEIITKIKQIKEYSNE